MVNVAQKSISVLPSMVSVSFHSRLVRSTCALGGMNDWMGLADRNCFMWSLISKPFSGAVPSAFIYPHLPHRTNPRVEGNTTVNHYVMYCCDGYL